MNDIPRQYFPAEVTALFAVLNPHDVEQFYRDYQLWSLQQEIGQLQAKINTLHLQLAENTARLQELHPSPIALAALAQLQARGVNDIDLLDRMLERGEDWLDQSMQRLAHCEKFAIISDNYTEWCEHALNGAYDWIDSVQESPAPDPGDEQALIGSPDASAPGEQVTEAMLLQKLMSDEDEVRPREVGEAQADLSTRTAPAEEIETESAAMAAQEVPSPQEQDATAEEETTAEEIARGEVTLEDKPADTAQKREQAPQPARQPRKRGFFLWLLHLFRS